MSGHGSGTVSLVSIMADEFCNMSPDIRPTKKIVDLFRIIPGVEKTNQIHIYECPLEVHFICHHQQQHSDEDEDRILELLHLNNIDIHELHEEEMIDNIPIHTVLPNIRRDEKTGIEINIDVETEIEYNFVNAKKCYIQEKQASFVRPVKEPPIQTNFDDSHNMYLYLNYNESCKIKHSCDAELYELQCSGNSR